MSDQDRIKLAEAMGAKCVDGVWHWKGSTWDSLIFDPFTDANDCEALMRHFTKELGVLFTIWYPHAEDQTAVDCSRDGYVLDRMKWRGDDWKHGVCELALKVIDSKQQR